MGRKSTDSRVDMNEVRTACTLINTADYCHATALEVLPLATLILAAADDKHIAAGREHPLTVR